MLHNITGIDHALIGVENLEGAKETFQKLGFTLTPRGSHIGWGTANYCIMFGNDYIELLGIVDPAKETNGLDRTLETRGEGLLGLALGSDNPEVTHKSLEVAGLSPSGLLELKRKLELPEGDVLPEFKLIRLNASAGLQEKHLFICHHLTPELVRGEPAWEVHDNGAERIASFVVIVEDPGALLDYYRQLCGFINVTLTDNTLTVNLGGGNLIFVNDRDIDLLYPGLTVDTGEGFPHLFAMTIGVRNLVETGRYLERAGYKTLRISNGSIRLDPSEACGVLLEFSDRAAS
ncbi:MAG: hypothetical protein EP348_03255 [Alphaproteobacteria bacterium]|nr:MAG: hypothetical protein EP348_03255 [Alphaproteobacteria bacterium]